MLANVSKTPHYICDDDYCRSPTHLDLEYPCLVVRAAVRAKPLCGETEMVTIEQILRLARVSEPRACNLLSGLLRT